MWHRVKEWAVRPPDDDAMASIDELIPQGDEFWPYFRRFMALIVLSSSIAAIGLLADSSAVVIGAMLVAPLMTPISAAGAATVQAKNGLLIQSVAVIVAGMVGAIAVGWLVALITRFSVTGASDLPGEIVSRTYPGLLDLGIAISAGAAAGFILPRRSTTGALPGVGIAVALVPPLATVGITARLGLYTQSGNALLLFTTNLAAIVFSVAIMLLATGFRPLTGRARSITRRLAITVGAVIAVAIPLALHTRSTIADVELRRAVVAAVPEWDDDARIVELQADVADGRASIDLLVSSPNTPRPAWRLAEGIQARFDGPVDLRLLYQQDALFQVSVR